MQFSTQVMFWFITFFNQKFNDSELATCIYFWCKRGKNRKSSYMIHFIKIIKNKIFQLFFKFAFFFNYYYVKNV